MGQGNHISNNVAEYAAVAEILKRTRDLEGEITIYGDSKLVIYQLRGEWRVKKGLYVPYYEDAKRLLDIQRSKPNFEWFGRDRNSECDQLSKRVLRERGIKLRIQPDEAR